MEAVSPLPAPGSEAASTEVVVAGGGVVGLFLACLLRQNGVDVVLLDPHVAPSKISPASVAMPRTLEVLNLVNCGAEIASTGRAVDLARIGIGGKKWHGKVHQLGTSMGRHSRHKATCISQGAIEALLAQRFQALGGRSFRATKLVSHQDGKDCVEAVVERCLELRPGEEPVELPPRLTEIKETVFTASYLVGCDGEKSQVRTGMNASYVGRQYKQAFVMVDLDVDSEEEKAIGWHEYQVQLACDWRSGTALSMSHLQGTTWRVSLATPRTKVLGEGQATQKYVQSKLEELLPSSAVPKRARYGDVIYWKVGCKLVETYRRGRCLLAGDAAHQLSPAASQGMNTGIQDAANLAWKIAAVLKGQATDSLLDTYEQERRTVTKGILVASDTTYRFFTGDMDTCSAFMKLMMLRAAFLCLPETELPPESVKDSLFGLSHSYGHIGTCWNSGGMWPQQAIAAGDRLPDIPCYRPDLGSLCYLLDVLKDPPCNSYHILFVKAASAAAAAAAGDDAAGSGRTAAETEEALAKDREEAIEAVNEMIAVLGPRFPLTAGMYLEDGGTEVSGAGVKISVLLPPPEPCSEPLLSVLLFMPPESKALLIVRPDGYIAIAHRGSWSTKLMVKGLPKILHPCLQ